MLNSVKGLNVTILCNDWFSFVFIYVNFLSRFTTVFMAYPDFVRTKRIVH